MTTDTKKALAEAIVKAIAEIEQMPRHSHAFVKVDRVKRRKSLKATKHQQALLGWIERRRFVRWEMTLGMHYGFLGGLMARGLVVETVRDGVRGVEVRDGGR